LKNTPNKKNIKRSGLSTKATTQFFSGDIFDNEALVLYYQTRESELYFRSVTRVGPKRAAYEQVSGAFGEFLKTLDDTNFVKTIDSFVFKNSKTKSTADSNILKALKKSNPEGFELMGLSGKVDFENLKKSYKKSAFKHHPDRGGSEEKMKVLNEAFNDFHRIVSFREEATFTEDGDFDIDTRVIPDSAVDYYLWIGMLLIDSHLDQWCIDKAFEIFEFLDENKLFKSRMWMKPDFRMEYADMFTKLSTRLISADLMNESKSVYEFSLQILRDAKNAGLNYGFLFDRVQKFIDGTANPRVVLKNIVQANNALRLGIIDEKKHDSLSERFGEREVSKENLDNNIKEFASGGGFRVPLSSEADLFLRKTPKDLVPVPDLFDERINHLSRDQLVEYFDTYKRGSGYLLIRKYIKVRMTSLIADIIYHFDDCQKTQFETEVKSLHKFVAEHRGEITAIGELYRYISSLPKSERAKRLEILQSLDEDSRRELSVTIHVQLDGETSDPRDAKGNHTWLPIHSCSTARYFEVASLPFDRLKIFQATGNEHTEEEQDKVDQDWDSDLTFIEKLDRLPMSKRAQTAAFEHKRDPKRIIKDVGPYVDKIFSERNKVSIKNAGEFQLGYWVDCLSAAYSKEKDYGSVVSLLDRFFDLPKQFFDRLEPSRRTKMENRREKAAMKC
jgi:hypothetical protein